jgi:CBS domain-containing protein
MIRAKDYARMCGIFLTTTPHSGAHPFDSHRRNRIRRGDFLAPIHRGGLAMRIREIMTEPVLTCTPHTSLAVAARLMREADYGTLPVVDAAGRLVGIITDRDVCLALAGTRRNAVNIAVREVMTPHVFSAMVDDDVRAALAVMKEHRVRRLPVRDTSGTLKGMVSIEDLVVRALTSDGLDPGDIVQALRAMYVRVPVRTDLTPGPSEFTPG